MRLDYYCPIYVEKRGKAISDPDKLNWLNGYIVSDEDADFTMHMDEDYASKVIGEKITLVAHEGTFYARTSIYEKKPLTVAHRNEITEEIIGQFMDGYGSHPLTIRRGLSSFDVHFVSDSVTPRALEYQITEFTPYPANQEQISSYSLVRGPFEVNTRPPKTKDKKASKKSHAEKLVKAAINGDLEVVKKLVEGGVDVDMRSRKLESFEPDFTALGWAANRDHFELAKYLIGQEADLNLVTRSGTPLTVAGSLEMVQLLLKAGANPTIKTETGMTAAEYHKNQASNYLDEDFDMMYNREKGEALLKIAAFIENWRS